MNTQRTIANAVFILAMSLIGMTETAHAFDFSIGGVEFSTGRKSSTVKIDPSREMARFNMSGDDSRVNWNRGGTSSIRGGDTQLSYSQRRGASFE